jgi:hypothetical protein
MVEGAENGGEEDEAGDDDDRIAGLWGCVL